MDTTGGQTTVILRVSGHGWHPLVVVGGGQVTATAGVVAGHGVVDARGQSEQSNGSGSGQLKAKGGQTIGLGSHHSGGSTDVSMTVVVTVRY